MTFFVNSLVESIGVNDKATKADIVTAPAITTLNSRNNRPVVPCKNTIGTNTATKATVVAITAKNISWEPLNPASSGAMPRSTLL